jgi:hypothetical protein
MRYFFILQKSDPYGPKPWKGLKHDFENYILPKYSKFKYCIASLTLRKNQFPLD